MKNNVLYFKNKSISEIKDLAKESAKSLLSILDKKDK